MQLTKEVSINNSKLISLIAMFWIASGHFLPIVVDIDGGSFAINNFSEFYLIPIFMLWRLKTEKDLYQKKRIKWMIFYYFVYWFTLPIIFKGSIIPLIDGTHSKLAASYHVIGSVGFFIYFTGTFLFGKRADCGWNCTCVFTRETVAFAFRDKTAKGKFWWNLRHLKWVFFIMVWVFFIFMIISPETTTKNYGKPMYKLILDLYYISFLFVPFIGHRNICRFVCPWAATWGVLNKIGPYEITANIDKCISCGICDRECDMGIPVQELIKTTGKIDTVECMGCNRCVTKCPKKVFEVKDFRDKIQGYNMSSMDRGVRVGLGITLSLFPFVYSGMIFTVIGVFSGLLFLSGLFGYCPFISLMKSRVLPQEN